MFDLLKAFDDIDLAAATMNSGADGFPTELYDVLVVDPPWYIERVAPTVYNRSAGRYIEYPTMTLDEIKALPIGAISAPNGVCFLWTIQRYLEESFKVLRAWGFKPKLTLTWNKTKGLSMFGFGYISEFIIVGTKGKLDHFLEQKVMPSVITASSTGHSIKPYSFYKYAEAFGEKRIDIFARTVRSGWDIWGNEV